MLTALRQSWRRSRDGLGLVPRAPDGSLALLLGRGAAADAALALGRMILQAVPRLPAFITEQGPERSIDPPAFLRLDAPWTCAGATRRWMGHVRPRLVLAAAGPRWPPAPIVREARRRGAGLALVTNEDDPPAPSRLLSEADVWIHVDPSLDRVTLRIRAGEAIVTTGGDLDRLVPALLQELHRTRQWRLRRLQSLGPGAAEPPALLQRMAAKWTTEWTSIADIGAALRHPATILCLGNGPSSEREDVQGLTYDRLFRVNWSWKARRRLDDPDLVFTTLETTVQKIVPRVGYVFKDRDTADSILGRRFRLRAIRYGVAQGLGLFDPGKLADLTLTNGAVMLALAVALQPERLVVAGIDLFADPAGAYPGDRRSTNDYTAGHSRALEREFICGLLGTYRGVLDIRSPVLAAALADFRRDP